jgi:hypothetical protein
MDSQNLSQTILQPTQSVIESTGTNGSFFDRFQNINISTWIIIFFILSFLGFNIFVYLAKGTQDITNFFKPLIEKIFGVTIAVTSEVVDVSAEGAKKVVSGTAGVINTGLTEIQNLTPNPLSASSSVKGQPVNQQQPPVQSPLNKALNSAQSQQPDYQADYANSSIQGGGKAGWCYIGQDRGFRSCAQVGVNDTCMSGDIFPSQEICLNPNLRS